MLDLNIYFTAKLGNGLQDIHSYPVNLLQWLQCSADHGSYSSVTRKNDSFLRPCSLRCSSECCCCQLDLLRTHLCKWLKVESTLTDEGIKDWRPSQIQRMSGCPTHNVPPITHLWFFFFIFSFKKKTPFILKECHFPALTGHLLPPFPAKRFEIIV